MSDYDDEFAGTDAGMSAIGKSGEWRSLSEVVPDCCLFDTVEPQDLEQGSIGDCWLISAFAALAEYPMAVRNMVQKSMFGDYYTVCLYSFESGSYKWVNVNDEVPCSGDQPLFVQPTKSNEIWPCIIEKAFAKYSGGYDQIKGGWSSFAIGALAGTRDLVHIKLNGDECTTMTPNFTEDTLKSGVEWERGDEFSSNEAFGMLYNANKWNYLMCVGSMSGSDDTFSDEGIVQGHAYSVLDVRRNPAMSGVNLIRLRNPWGDKEWTGAWSDGSSEWDDNPMVAALLPHEEADDGAFWISWEDFQEQYKTIYVGKKNMGLADGPCGVPNPFVLLKSFMFTC